MTDTPPAADEPAKTPQRPRKRWWRVVWTVVTTAVLLVVVGSVALFATGADDIFDPKPDHTEPSPQGDETYGTTAKLCETVKPDLYAEATGAKVEIGDEDHSDFNDSAFPNIMTCHLETTGEMSVAILSMTASEHFDTVEAEKYFTKQRVDGSSKLDGPWDQAFQDSEDRNNTLVVVQDDNLTIELDYSNGPLEVDAEEVTQLLTEYATQIQDTLRTD